MAEDIIHEAAAADLTKTLEQIEERLNSAEAVRAQAGNDYQWAVREAKNILRCISIAHDHTEAVAEDLQPCITTAIDGVARLLDLATNEWESQLATGELTGELTGEQQRAAGGVQ